MLSCMLQITHHSKHSQNHHCAIHCLREHKGCFIFFVVAVHSVLHDLHGPELSSVLNTPAGKTKERPSYRDILAAPSKNRLVRSDGIYSYTILDRWWVTDPWISWLQFKPSYLPSCLRLGGNQTQQCTSLMLLL